MKNDLSWYHFPIYYLKGIGRSIGETWKFARKNALTTFVGIGATIVVGVWGTNAASNSNLSTLDKILVSVVSFLGLFLIVLIPKVIYMPFEIYRERRNEIRTLKKMMEPKVDLIVGNDRPFYDLADDHVVCRVGIKSLTSAKNVTGVTVHLDSTIPESGVDRDVPLHWKDDNETPHTESKDIRPDKMEYVDVLSVWKRGSPNRDHVSIQHIVPRVGRNLYGNFHKLKICIYADGMNSTEKELVVARNGDTYWFGYDGALVNIDGVMDKLPNLDSGRGSVVVVETKDSQDILGYLSGGSIQPLPENLSAPSASVLVKTPKKGKWERKPWKKFPPDRA
jgi:hypothetical protein